MVRTEEAAAFRVTTWSMVADLLIAVKTVKVIVSHIGAY